MLIQVIVDAIKDQSQPVDTNNHRLEVISLQGLPKEAMKQILTAALKSVSNDDPLVLRGEDAKKVISLNSPTKN